MTTSEHVFTAAAAATAPGMLFTIRQWQFGRLRIQPVMVSSGRSGPLFQPTVRDRALAQCAVSCSKIKQPAKTIHLNRN